MTKKIMIAVISNTDTGECTTLSIEKTDLPDSEINIEECKEDNINMSYKYYPYTFSIEERPYTLSLIPNHFRDENTSTLDYEKKE